MTARTKAAIKAFFETGDAPTQTQFGDLVDSYAQASAAISSFAGAFTATVSGGVATATLASAAVGTTNIEGRAVSLPKIAFGTVGNILYYAASGVPTLLAAGTSGQVLTMGASIPSWSSAAAATGGLPNGGYAANRYYLGAGTLFNTSGGALSANTLYASPFNVGAATTFTRIGISVTTGSPGNARLGIYNWADGAPSTLVADCGTVSVASTAVVEVTISQALSPGIYALVLVTDTTPTVRLATTHALSNSYMGAADSTGNTDALYITRAFSYASLPTPFGSPTYVAGTSGPAIWLRVV